MTDNNSDSRTRTLQNGATRERWDLFHRAIAQAKQVNALAVSEESERSTLKPVSLESTGT